MAVSPLTVLAATSSSCSAPTKPFDARSISMGYSIVALETRMQDLVDSPAGLGLITRTHNLMIKQLEQLRASNLNIKNLDADLKRLSMQDVAVIARTARDIGTTMEKEAFTEQARAILLTASDLLMLIPQFVANQTELFHIRAQIALLQRPVSST